MLPGAVLDEAFPRGKHGCAPALHLAERAEPADAAAYHVVVTNPSGSATSTAATLSVLTIEDVFIEPAGIVNDEFQMTISGPVGQTVRVEWTTDFQTWTPITSFTFGLAPVTFSDPIGSNVIRFYRVAPQP